MEVKTVTVEEKTVAVIENERAIIKDVQSALDVMMTARYECGENRSHSKGGAGGGIFRPQHWALRGRFCRSLSTAA